LNYTFLESSFEEKSKECENNNISILNENGQQLILNVVNGASDNFEMNVNDGHPDEIETHANNNISYEILQENVEKIACNIKNKEHQNSKVNTSDKHLKINDSTCSLLLESVEHTVSSMMNAGSNIPEVNKENTQKEQG